MQKIMFNDRYGLTQAVIEGRKTMTRRMITGYPMSSSDRIEEACYSAGSIGVIANGGETLFELKPRFKVGEELAVAQRYNDATKEYPHLKTTLVGHDIMGSESGCLNKMFVKADLMPHRIRITAIRCERLQEISDEDCFREGISESWYESTDTTAYGFADEMKGTAVEFDTPREAFTALIDKVSGRGTWERNPWVVVYEFELVK